MGQRPQRRWNLMAITAVIIAAVLALSAVNWLSVPELVKRDSVQLSSTTTQHHLSPVRGRPLSPREQELDQAQRKAARFQMTVGVYVTSSSELELNVPSYSASGYVWLRWQEPFQRYLKQIGSTADQQLTLLNSLLSNGDATLSRVGEPLTMEDGSYYQLLSFRGRYYIDSASFRRYPFLSLSLPLAIEPDDTDGQLDYTNLRLIPDTKNSGIGLYADIIGWLNRGWTIAEYRHQYDTNFGFPGGDSAYSQIIYEIVLGSSAWASFWRLLLPLAVLMTMVLLVFKVRSDEQDARASIPVTVLLTLVFLQQTYRERLPDLPYLTFLDQVYVVAYVVTLVAFGLVIWIGRRYLAIDALEEGPAKQQQLARIERLDVIWPLMVVVFGATAIAGCWLTIPAGL